MAFKNGSGYNDPTAGAAIRNIDKDVKDRIYQKAWERKPGKRRNAPKAGVAPKNDNK